MNAAFSRPPSYTFAAIRTRAFCDFASSPSHAKLTSVLAPPGYGKTILLAEIHRELERQGHKAIWIGADANAGSATSFLFEMEQRLLSNETDFGEAFAYQQMPTIRERIERVLTALEATGGTLFLVLDNTDLGSEEETRRLIDALVFETPECIRLVVSSSTRPAFDATRALLELKLKTISAADLGFRLDDISLLLEEAGVSDLDKSLATQILQQSEGWPAAVRLLQVLTSKGASAPDSDRRAWAGDDSLLETLFERLLDRLQPELQTFLIELSIFPAFSAALLAAATQSERAAAFLHYLVDSKILITSLSEQGDWFRLHALFRRYLMRLAQERLSAERQRSIALRGAQWLERQERIADSLELALEAEDGAMCARLLEKLSWTLVRSAGNLSSFTGWVERSRAKDVILGSEARFWYLWTLIFERRYDEASRELNSFAKSLKQTSYSDERQAMLRAKVGLAEIVLKLHLDDMPAVRALASPWLEQDAGKDSFETGAASGALALAQGADLDFTAGHSSALISIASVAPSASLYGKAWARNIWACLELMLGNPREVDLRIRDLQAAIGGEIGQETLIGAVTAIVRANALYHLGQEREAVAIAQAQLARASDCGMLDFVWLALEILTPKAILEETDNPLLNTLQAVAERYPARLSRLLEYRRIRLLCLDNKMGAAIQIAGRLGLWVNSQCMAGCPSGMAPSEALVRNLTVISLMTLVGEHDQAAALIEDGLQAARRAGNRRASIEYLLARSTLFWRTARSAEATSAFSRAVVLASEVWLQSPFLENGALVGQIIAGTPLKHLGLVTETSRAFLASLNQAGSSQETRNSPDGEHLVEELTKRELSLLQMLNEGKDNAQIAQQADIAVRTVKWHLRNLYAKLNVKNRTAALARAREIGLI